MKYLGFSFGLDRHPLANLWSTATQGIGGRKTRAGSSSCTAKREPGERARPAMSELAKGCEHFLDYRQNHGLQSFKIIYKYLVKPEQEARKLKVRRVRCWLILCPPLELHWADTPSMSSVCLCLCGKFRNAVVFLLCGRGETRITTADLA